MSKTLTSIIAIGIGAVAYMMMRDRKSRKRVMSYLEPIRQMNLNKMMPKFK